MSENIIEIAWRAGSVAPVFSRQQVASIKTFMAYISSCVVGICAYLTGIRKIPALTASIGKPIDNKQACAALLYAKSLIIYLPGFIEIHLTDIYDGGVRVVNIVYFLGEICCRSEDGGK